MDRSPGLLKFDTRLSDEGLHYIPEERIVMLPIELGEQDQDQEKERDPVVERIKDGFFHFKTQHFNNCSLWTCKYPDYYQQLAEEQRPKFLVFACSDSRVSPSFILNFKPGEALVARHFPNIIPAFNQSRNSGVGAMIESAVNNLSVESILVIGHSRGGIKGLMSLPDGTTSNDSIDDWDRIGLLVKDKLESEYPDSTSEEKCTHCETEAVNLSLVNLLTYPYVRFKVVTRALKVMGGYYDFVKGNFNLWKADFAVKTYNHDIN